MTQAEQRILDYLQRRGQCLYTDITGAFELIRKPKIDEALERLCARALIVRRMNARGQSEYRPARRAASRPRMPQSEVERAVLAALERHGRLTNEQLLESLGDCGWPGHEFVGVLEAMESASQLYRAGPSFPWRLPAEAPVAADPTPESGSPPLPPHPDGSTCLEVMRKFFARKADWRKKELVTACAPYTASSVEYTLAQLIDLGEVVRSGWGRYRRAGSAPAEGSTGNPAAEPQPAPEAGQERVYDLVVRDLADRMRVGTEKYGTPLMTGNGRDPLLDAYQEALDLVMYLRQALAERGAAADERG